MRLWAERLRCVRGGREIFDGLDFSVAAGEALAVTGANGAGKSSLLRLIAGLILPAGGRLVLEGGPDDTPIAEQSHYLGHRDAFKPALTVSENLAFWRDFLGAPMRSVGDALDAVGLGHAAHLPAAYLSAGQKRRLSLARLIAVNRPLWLLDEPTSALDIAAQATLAGFMKAHLAAGGLIVAATHGPLGLEAARNLMIGGRAAPIAAADIDPPRSGAEATP